jgi:hypothetical protein
MSQKNTNNEPCCPKFDTTPWDEKNHWWQVG